VILLVEIKRRFFRLQDPAIASLLKKVLQQRKHMEDQNDFLLINYLDRALEENEKKEIEALTKIDLATRTHFHCLRLAVQAVEYAENCDRMAVTKEQYKVIQPAEVIATSYGEKRNTGLTRYRVAVGLLFAITALALFNIYYYNISSFI